MEWINENSGILVLIGTILVVALLALCIFLMISLRNRIAVQRLKILGLFAVDFDSRERYAEITVANKSLNDVGIAELGIQNGITNFDLTPLYKEKSGYLPDTRVVIEQRSAITFRLSGEELLKVLLNGEKKPLKKLRFYAIDLTGTLYRGRLRAIQKLLATMLYEQKNGIVYTPELPEAAVKAQEDKAQQAQPAQVAPPEPQPYQNVMPAYSAPSFVKEHPAGLSDELTETELNEEGEETPEEETAENSDEEFVQ